MTPQREDRPNFSLQHISSQTSVLGMPAPRRSAHREASTSSPRPGLSEAGRTSSPLTAAANGVRVAIDLGSYSIRICVRKSKTSECRITCCPNALIRPSQKQRYFSDGNASSMLAGPQITYKCSNFGSLTIRQPMDRGMIIDWPTQKTILDAALVDALEKAEITLKSGERLLEGADVILTETYFNLPDLQAGLDLLFTEAYGVNRVSRCTAAQLVLPHPQLFSLGAGRTVQVDKRQRPECICIVDLGHNSTHVVPVIGNEIVWGAVKRHIISQRILTNLLKETISFRQWDMMDESWLIGHVKERTCFVASNSGRRGDIVDMGKERPSTWSYAAMVQLCATSSKQQNPLVLQYVLPDYSAASSKEKLGYVRGEEGIHVNPSNLDDFIVRKDNGGSNNVRFGTPHNGLSVSDEEGDADGSDDDFREDADDERPDRKMVKERPSARKANEEEGDLEQSLVLERERFQIPETMFDPGIAGLDDAPLHRVVKAAIKSCEEEVQDLLWSNIVLIGGGAAMPGLKERLQNELRSLAPVDVPMQMWTVEQPSLCAIEGAQVLLTDEKLRQRIFVTDIDHSNPNRRTPFNLWSTFASNFL